MLDEFFEKQLSAFQLSAIRAACVDMCCSEASWLCLLVKDPLAEIVQLPL
jgi:hypothetical protein